MSDPGRGGRGKKAPYETQHYRIPTPLKPVVAMLTAIYRQWVEETEDSCAITFIKRLEDAIVITKNESAKLNTRFKDLTGEDTEPIEEDQSENEDEDDAELAKELDKLHAKAYQDLITDKKMLEREIEKLQNQLDDLKVEKERAMSILAPALKINANSGGKIKAAIREAFPGLAIK